MVMGDGASGGDHRFAGGGLELRPLLELAAQRGGAGEAVVGRGAIGIDVGEAAGEAGAFA